MRFFRDFASHILAFYSRRKIYKSDFRRKSFYISEAFGLTEASVSVLRRNLLEEGGL